MGGRGKNGNRGNLGHAARSRAGRLGVRAEGDSAVRYWAHNGNEYRVDVSKMVQTKLSTGKRRVVLREVLEGFGVAWSFESSPSGAKHGQCAVYMQYPNEVTAVLEHRYRAFCVKSLAVKQDPKSSMAVEAAVQKLNNASLRSIFGLNVAETSTAETSTEMSAMSSDEKGFKEFSKTPLKSPPASGDDSCDPESSPESPKSPGRSSRRSRVKIAARLAARVSSAEPALAECLFERVLQSKWPPQEVAAAVRWLYMRGLQCSPEHCRKAALVHGSLTVLRVLLIEAQVDVRGLELLVKAPVAASRGKASSNTGNGDGWVHRCKAPIKVLLARGALIGSTGTRSKLLRRLEEDADMLLRARVLATLCEPLPDDSLGKISDFAGVEAPFAWRIFTWKTGRT